MSIRGVLRAEGAARADTAPPAPIRGSAACVRSPGSDASTAPTAAFCRSPTKPSGSTWRDSMPTAGRSSWACIPCCWTRPVSCWLRISTGRPGATTRRRCTGGPRPHSPGAAKTLKDGAGSRLCVRRPCPKEIRERERGASNFQRPTSNIERPTSNVQHRTSNIERPTLNVERRGGEPVGGGRSVQSVESVVAESSPRRLSTGLLPALCLQA